MKGGDDEIYFIRFCLTMYLKVCCGNWRYAGETYGIANTFATIPGMIAPTLVNAMTPNVSSTTALLLT